MSHKFHNRLYFAIGANVSGHWGAPRQTIVEALRRLEALGIAIEECSSVYSTSAQSHRRQPRFMNLVASAKCHHPSLKILNIFNRLEIQAGRVRNGANGPRPLDLDIIDHSGRVVNWPNHRRRSKLVLPHPEIVNRAFVLVPLHEIAPGWRHPVNNDPVGVLLRCLRTSAVRRSDDVRRVDSIDFS